MQDSWAMKGEFASLFLNDLSTCTSWNWKYKYLQATPKFKANSREIQAAYIFVTIVVKAAESLTVKPQMLKSGSSNHDAVAWLVKVLYPETLDGDVMNSEFGHTLSELFTAHQYRVIEYSQWSHQTAFLFQYSISQLIASKAYLNVDLLDECCGIIHPDTQYYLHHIQKIH